MAKKEYRFAKKEKLRDHPFAKYIRKEVPKEVMVNVERVKPKTKRYMVKVERVKQETKTVKLRIKKVKQPKQKIGKFKIEKVTKWGNKKFVKKSKTR